MLKRLQLALGVVAAVLIAGSAWASAPGSPGDPGGVAGSPHNLNNSGFATPDSQVCVSCHTPHAANLSNWQGALWNHSTTTQTFTTYTTKQETLGQPTGSSKMCLSCHDGITAVDAFNDTITSGTTAMTGREVLGTDLSNDHPIGVLYPTGGAYNQDYDLMKADGIGTSKGVQLIGGVSGSEIGTGYVECRSCHHSHNNLLGNFLRTSNTASALCRKCHTK